MPSPVSGGRWPEGPEGVELDGSQHVDRADPDARRDAFLRSHGYRVLRFWNGDVTANTTSVLDTIFAALHCQQMDGRFD